MPSSPSAWRRLRARLPGRGWLRRFLPRTLFWRSFIIIVAPMVLLQAVVTYLFFDRHYEVTTRKLSRAVAGSIAGIFEIYDDLDGRVTIEELARVAGPPANLEITYDPDAVLPDAPTNVGPLLERTIAIDLANRIGRPVWIDATEKNEYFDIRIALDGGVLRIVVQRKFIMATNIHIFIVWMIVSAVVLITIALLFLRGQVRPIQRLADAAEAFGMGRDVVDYSPAGASEVRAAGHAFLDMKERIQRFLTQRTEMLAGVSHDLKTPLTRMKLELAMLKDQSAADSILSDVREMERMLDEYLAFARGEGGEPVAEVDVAELVREAAADARRKFNGEDARVRADAAGTVPAKLRRNAFKRCLANLIDNALKYGTHTAIALERGASSVDIVVDDDGPGIAMERREEAFRPFHRLDQGRNLDAGGVGLGLAIARDIARAHGGDIILEDSPMGGLRAVLHLPV